MKHLFLIAVLFSALTGCVKDPEFVGIKNFKITGKNDTALFTTASVEILNTNYFGITGHDIAYQIFINNRKVGSGASQKEIHLPKKQISTIDNYTEISIKDIIQEAEFILGKDSVPVEFSVSGNFTRMDIHKEKKVKMYLKPSLFMEYLLDASLFEKAITLSNIKITGISAAKSLMEVDIALHNDYPIEFTVESINVDILDAPDNGNLLGKWQTDSVQTVQANQTAMFFAQLEIDNANAAMSFLKSIFGGGQELGYFAKGIITININNQSFKVPILQPVKL